MRSAGAERGSAPADPRLVDVGGRRLALWEDGAGSPTVVLEMGLGAPGSLYANIARQVAGDARVVWYDRAGLGLSDPAPTPRTIGDIAFDLHTLLQAARIPGPYVLAGHSMGGLAVRLYRHRHPEEVAALVLIDSAHEDQRARFLAALPPERPDEHSLLAQRRRALLVDWADPAANPEGIDNLANSELMRDCGALGDLPLVVISAGRPTQAPPEASERRDQAWQGMQRELARLSSRGVHLIADRSGHMMNEDQPDMVLAGIRRAVALARAEA